MQNWFHIKALGATVDLAAVCAISWNYRLLTFGTEPPKIITVLHLKNGIFYNSDAEEMERDEWWIKDDEERQELFSRLFPEGCPIELELNEPNEQ